MSTTGVVPSSREPGSPLPGRRLEQRITAIGDALGRALAGLVDALDGDRVGPQALARRLSIDKVLASRLLKAARNRDPLAVVHLAPGPEPLRRVVRAAARQDLSPALLDDATSAIDEFEQLIRQDAGDRGALDAIISAWLPDARREFEVRRKQAAFKAMSQLRGAMAEWNVATAMLHPASDPARLDIVWISGLLGLQRLRPRVGVKFATRRIVENNGPRRPTSLDGVPVDGLEGVRLDDFCSSPPPGLEVVRAGEVVHYQLADTGFGPRSAVDLVFAEVNRAEMARYVDPELRRKGYVFAEISTPVKTLQFDVFLHEDVYPGSEPGLLIYDTALDGVADVNDRARDIDRLDLAESIEPLGTGISRFRSARVPGYARLIDLVCTKMDWDGTRFRGYRCQIEYPLYGTQVAMTFDPPPPPAST